MGGSFLEATREQGWLLRVFFEGKLSKYSDFFVVGPFIYLCICLCYFLNIEPSNVKSYH